MMFMAITLAEWLKQVSLNFSICIVCMAGVVAIGSFCTCIIVTWQKLCSKLRRKPSTIEEISAKIDSHLDNIESALERIAQKIKLEDK